MNVPEQAGAAFGAAVEANEKQRPERVAEAIVKLVNTESGKRPFRTVVDHMGMGDPISGYNTQLEEIMKAIYGNMQMEGMLETNS